MQEPPVLLVHGLASSFERNWREPGWVDLLADAGRDVIGPDLLGHGRAEKPHDPAAYADLTSVVADALPAEGQVDAVGFSLGAAVLLRLAATRPERFRKIVVGGVGANLFRGGDPEPIARAVETGGAEGVDHPVARFFAGAARSDGNDPRALAACLRRPERPLTVEELGRVSCPVLVVLGDRDFAGPADPLVEALPDATFKGIPGLDHFGTPKDFRFLDAALEYLGALPT